MTKKTLIANSTNKPKALPPSSDNACDSLDSTNTKASGENPVPATQGKLPAPPLQERLNKFIALRRKVNEAREVRDEDVRQLRQILVSTPELHFVADMGWDIRGQLLNKVVVQGSPKATMLAKLDLMTKEFGYESAPAIERLLIDHVLTCWLRMEHAELLYNDKAVGQPLSTDVALYWEQHLAAVQRRWLAAVESLARVRRLGARSPLFQVNIAQHGGQQVNTQRQ